MKPAVAEWVSKAEGDFVTAGRELRVRSSPNYDAVCFHAQQCAEKFLKADLEVLEDYSVRFRYPGDMAEKEDARSAYKAVEAVRAFARQKLGAN